jgi:RNA polymerase sigma-70 factor (ECF subfamily)
VIPELPVRPALDHDRFNTTRWSVVLSSAKSDGDRSVNQAALSDLCRMYWRPIFAFICRRGYSVTDAQDLTQDFFVNVIEGTLLQRADPSRGRFRSLLLTSLQNFLIDAHEKRSAQKRGGGKKFVSWDDWMEEGPSELSVPPHLLASWTPERLFDIRWAATVVDAALARLREECNVSGRRRVFEALRHSLSAEPSEMSYETIAQQLGIAPAVVKRLVYQMRRQYRLFLRDEVARTVEDEADIEEEIRYLCAVLAATAK